MQVVIDGMAWIPLDSLAPQQLVNLRDALTVWPKATSDMGEGDPGPVYLYREAAKVNGNAIGIPREFYRANRTESHELLVHVSDGDPMGDVQTSLRFTGEFEEQERALVKVRADLEEEGWGGALVRAGCGWGKTIWAIEFARRMGRRTLIVVHKEFLLKQWKDRIERYFPGARVGIVRQSQCEFEDKDFVIGLVHSLALGVSDRTRYPHKLWKAFGLVITDEVHRIGAQTWAPVVPAFNARYRIGLTATPRRKDGAENVFRYHIGPVAFSAQKEMLVPKVRRVWTETRMKPISRGRYKVAVENLKSSQVISQLCDDPMRTRLLAEQIAAAVRVGRKVLIISERLEHLRDLARESNELLARIDPPFAPVADFFTGEWFTGEKDRTKGERKKKRTDAQLERAEQANMVFATKQMIEEGLDIQALDTLVLATPIGDVEQAAGRIRRVCKPEPDKCARLCPWRAGRCDGKPEPIVVDVIDEHVERAKQRWYSRNRWYKELGSL